MQNYAFLGGAFDPIHWGHIKSLIALQKQLNYKNIFILPYNLSPTGKETSAPVTHRLQMTKLAVSSYDDITIKETDIHKNTPAYTYDSLLQLREEYGSECHFSFIIGDDCYANFNQWHRWQEIYQLTNLVVINRTENEVHPEVATAEKNYKLIDVRSGGENIQDELQEFITQLSGCILKLHTPIYPISSSAIREKLAKEQDPSGLLPQPVMDYINSQNLYN